MLGGSGGMPPTIFSDFRPSETDSEAISESANNFSAGSGRFSPFFYGSLDADAMIQLNNTRPLPLRTRLIVRA